MGKTELTEIIGIIGLIKFIKEKGERLKDKGFGFYSPPRRQERREFKLTADTRRFTQTAFDSQLRCVCCGLDVVCGYFTASHLPTFSTSIFQLRLS